MKNRYEIQDAGGRLAGIRQLTMAVRIEKGNIDKKRQPGIWLP